MISSLANLAEKAGLSRTKQEDLDCLQAIIELKLVKQVLNRPLSVMFHNRGLVKVMLRLAARLGTSEARVACQKAEGLINLCAATGTSNVVLGVENVLVD